MNIEGLEGLDMANAWALIVVCEKSLLSRNSQLERPTPSYSGPIATAASGYSLLVFFFFNGSNRIINVSLNRVNLQYILLQETNRLFSVTTAVLYSTFFHISTCGSHDWSA
jgi:hypothetical protein